MKWKELENIFQWNRFYTNVENIFLEDNVENTICNIKLDSNLLFILPDTKNLANIKNYHNLNNVEINNYKIGKNEMKILENNISVFDNVTHLRIWNIKQNDIEIVKYFPKLTHLYISYIRKKDFSFDGLRYLNNINTLWLSSANQINDFNFMDNSDKLKIKNFELTYCKRLNSLSGIDKFANMETLHLHASTPESRQRIALENIDGIELLSNLKNLDMAYFDFKIEDLQNKIRNFKKLKEYTIDFKDYQNEL